MLTQAQIEAGRAVKRALQEVEERLGRPAVRQLHQRLADLRDTFRPDLSDGDFQAFGGGTPKTPDSDE